MRRAAMLALVAVVLASPAGAQVTTKPNQKIMALLPAKPGERACYTHRYDAAHMKEHPKQRVTAMTLSLRAIGIGADGNWVLDPAGKFERVEYQFAIEVARRGVRAASASGYCPDGKDALCIRECDGGGAILEPIAGSDALTLRLTDGGIRLGDCAGKKPDWLKPGADDQSFRIEKVAADQCAALEKAQFGQ